MGAKTCPCYNQNRVIMSSVIKGLKCSWLCPFEVVLVESVLGAIISCFEAPLKQSFQLDSGAHNDVVLYYIDLHEDMFIINLGKITE